jgi:hypothetical protein
MNPHQKAALELIHDYYFMLPNNGLLNSGINSCESRYKEAVDCALLSVKQLILTLEFMSMEPNSAFVMDRINFYDEVTSELYGIKNGYSKLSWEELIEVFKK